MSRFALNFISFCLSLTFSHGLNLKPVRDLNYAKFKHDLEHVFLGRSSTTDTLCCANGRWEANAFVFANTLLSLENINMSVFYNGTGKIAFDDENKKSYISFNVTEFLPGEPKHYQKTSTTIKDFVTGITYNIDDGSCFKQPGSADMKLICIPDNAKQISAGMFGNTNVLTYQFSTTGEFHKITTASVIQKGALCETIMLSYALVADGNVPEQFVYDVEVVDISKGIKDPSVFVPPKSCN